MPPKRRNIDSKSLIGQTLNSRIRSCKDLTFSSRTVLIYLIQKASYLERLWISNQTIADESGLSYRAVSEAIRDLENLKFIARRTFQTAPNMKRRFLSVLIKTLMRIFKVPKRKKRKKLRKIDKYPPSRGGRQNLPISSLSESASDNISDAELQQLAHEWPDWYSLADILRARLLPAQ